MVTKFKRWFYSKRSSTKNADPDKYSYWGHVIGSDFCSLFSFPNFDCGKNVIIFRIGNNPSVHIDNKKEDILVLGKDPKQGLDDTRMTAEAKYSINFSRSGKKLFKPIL